MEDMDMANFMKAYTIAFEGNDGKPVLDRDIVPFFEKIEQVLKTTPNNVIRKINGKIMRVHAYEWNRMNKDYVAIPVGKLKEKNKPFGSDPKTQKLIDIPQEMFDVNVIAYHRTYQIALISTNQQGPTDNDIEAYLKSYLPADAQYKIRLTPIIRNIELENIRNAQEARSITISLNVGRPLNNFLLEQTHEERSVYEHLKALMEYSKETLDSNTFTLTLGLGRKRNATLDVGALIDLLDSINLSADCISEIEVNYRNGPSQKIDVAKLKNSSTILKIFFPVVGTQLGAEYILNNMDEILRGERSKYFNQVRDYFSNAIEIGEEYEVESNWDERAVV